MKKLFFLLLKYPTLLIRILKIYHFDLSGTEDNSLIIEILPYMEK